MYIVRRLVNSDYLSHAERKDHKYTDKKLINGKWYYYYEDDTTSKSTNSTTSKDTSKTSTDTEHDKIVKEILAGKWGNGKDRKEKLAKAGYDYATIQNKVNEKLGNSYRHKITTGKEATSKTINKSKNKTVSSMGKESRTGESIVDEMLKK